MSKKREIRREPMVNSSILSVNTDKLKLNLPKVSISIFLQVSGIKRDQLAGFKYYAKSKDIESLTIPQWREEYENYLNKPVK